MARFFSGLLDEVSKILGLTGKPRDLRAEN
jgi:hypothetical protein